MPDRDLDEDLPIVDEIGARLDALFHAHAQDGPAPAAAPSGSARPSATASRGRRFRRRLGAVRPRVLAAGGLVAAALLFAVFLTADGEVGPRPASAAEVLHRLASTAAAQDDRVPADDEWYTVRARASNLVTAATPGTGGITAVVVKDRRIWISAGRRGRLEERIRDTRFLTPVAQAAWKRAGSPPIGRSPATAGAIAIAATGTYRLGAARLSRAELLALPADVEQLLAVLGLTGASASERFTAIGDALREAPAPAGVRATLVRALSDVPGVTALGELQDPAGRAAVGVAVTERGLRNELLFDPSTSEVLAERRIAVAPADAGLDVPRDAVIGETVYAAREVVDTLP